MKFIITLENVKHGNVFDVSISARSHESAVAKFRKTEYASDQYIVRSWVSEKK